MHLIQILGPGCPRCNRLHENVHAAVARLGAPATIERITDMDQITSFEVMMTPALVIDGQVKTVGRVPSPEEIGRWLGAGL